MTDDTWNITTVRARQAMRIVQQAIGGGDWETVKIAHIDTGYTNHCVFHMPPEAPSGALLAGLGVNYVEAGKPPLDPLTAGLLLFPGHGTRTTGVLCGDKPGTFVGMAPGVPVIPYRVAETVVLHKETIVNAAKALRHALEQRQAPVISISLGVQSVFGNKTQMRQLGRAVDAAYEAGAMVVAACGQTRQNAPDLMQVQVYPSRYSRAVAVAGVNQKRRICYDYEHDRDWIDVWAPADEIPRPNSLRGGGDRQCLIEQGGGDGTSYATVHVSAAAAMWLRVRGRELDDGGYAGWRRIEAFRKLLRTTARPIQGNDVTGGGPVPTDGRGILDCEALLKAPLPPLASLRKQQRLAENEVD
ncbi:MAG: S8/S53 family peptidase [Rhodospirillales bacterium]|nr:S8/S53 family peptidase [Rhodospirillales bacterium]